MRLVCEGYIALGRPIPEEFWDEWDAICEKDRAAAEAQTAEEKLLEIPPEPMEVWCITDRGDFKMEPDGPAVNGQIKLHYTSMPWACTVKHYELRKDGVLLAEFQAQMSNTALVAGDSLTLTMDAPLMLSLLKP